MDFSKTHAAQAALSEKLVEEVVGCNNGDEDHFADIYIEIGPPGDNMFLYLIPQPLTSTSTLISSRQTEQPPLHATARAQQKAFRASYAGLMSTKRRSSTTAVATGVLRRENTKTFVVQELAESIVIKRPSDHILCLKRMLINRGQEYKESSKVILIAPPYIDKEKLAYLISNAIGVLPVDLDVIKTSESKGCNLKNTSPDIIAKYASKVLKSEIFHNLGWILYDYPRNYEEALALQRIGVIATHVIQLVSSLKESDVDDKNELQIAKVLTHDIHEYYKNLPGLRTAYQSVLKVCKVKDRTIQQLAEDCANLARIMPHRGAPMLPRVLIVGACGSGRKTQAKLLSHRFNLVHVDLEGIVEQAKLGEDSIAYRLKMLLKHAVPIYPDIIAFIVKRRLLMSDCLDRGWVLTGYPRNVNDFKALDLMETPPNRVVFLNVSFNVCCKRLTERRINFYTGTTYHLLNDPPCSRDKHNIATHPRDYKHLVYEQVSYYESVKDEMKTYCGLTATYLNGEYTTEKVSEMMQAVVIRSAPREQHRIPESPAIEDDCLVLPKMKYL